MNDILVVDVLTVIIYRHNHTKKERNCGLILSAIAIERDESQN